MKKNVELLKNGLAKLLQLRGVSFEWKDPAEQGNLTGTQTGMVAQDVEKLFPGWVSEGPDEMKNLTFRGFEALTVEAFRELNVMVEALSQHMNAMEQRIGLLDW